MVHLLLAKASNQQQMHAVGNQTGGRVFLFLHSNDFWRDYNSMKSKGVVFNESQEKSLTALWWCFRIYMATNGTCLSLNTLKVNSGARD